MMPTIGNIKNNFTILNVSGSIPNIRRRLILEATKKYKKIIFLKKFADALHQVNKKLSVDFFSNLPFWDLGALNSSTTDYLISMDTYVPGNATFEAYLQVAQGHISGSNIGLGMCTGTRPAPFTPYGPDPCGLNPWTAERLTERFNALTEKLLKAKTGSVGKPFAMLNLWVLPLPAIWWKYLESVF